MKSYREEIQELIENSPLDIDTEIQMKGRVPTMAGSEFLTNKEQGDWAEAVVLKAINENSNEYIAVAYGRNDDLAAGDDGFKKFYENYQRELNTIGKKPDVLIYRQSDIKDIVVDTDNVDHVKLAIAAIEVRSSSFLIERYSAFMKKRSGDAEAGCIKIQSEILKEPYNGLLLAKRPEIHKLIREATLETFRELDFRTSNYRTSEDLIKLSSLLADLKSQIKILHKRDFLSITPKLEDIALVNRWIDHFGVKHFYLQVFFDKAYMISFKGILNLVSDSDREKIDFSIERDIKNQGKTTIKVNTLIGKEVIGKVDMPEHLSKLKELDRGRLLYYVSFKGGKGYLDSFRFEEVLNE